MACIHGCWSAMAATRSVACFRRPVNWLDSMPCGRCGRCSNRSAVAYPERDGVFVAYGQAVGDESSNMPRTTNAALGAGPVPQLPTEARFRPGRIPRLPTEGDTRRRKRRRPARRPDGLPSTLRRVREDDAPSSRCRYVLKSVTAGRGWPAAHNRRDGSARHRWFRTGRAVWDSEGSEQPRSARELRSAGTPSGGTRSPADSAVAARELRTTRGACRVPAVLRLLVAAIPTL